MRPDDRVPLLHMVEAAESAETFNEQYWICFRWEAGDAYEVEIADYH